MGPLIVSVSTLGLEATYTVVPSSDENGLHTVLLTDGAGDEVEHWDNLSWDRARALIHGDLERLYRWAIEGPHTEETT